MVYYIIPTAYNLTSSSYKSVCLSIALEKDIIRYLELRTQRNLQQTHIVSAIIHAEVEGLLVLLVPKYNECTHYHNSQTKKGRPTEVMRVIP